MARKRASEIKVNEAWCKRCGICIAFCPTKVLEAGAQGIPRVANLEACTVCLLCELRCPDFAIEVEEAREEARHVPAPADAG
ncbi:MAG: 4Fe-4S binding protein [Bacillota bacterium]